MSRSDLGFALAQGSKPMFLDMLTKEPLMDFPDLESFLGPTQFESLSMVLPGLDEKLEGQWISAIKFTALVNYAASSGQKMSTRLFLQAMVSIMYGLLGIGPQSNILNEAVRLGLLAYSCSAFLQWRTVGMPYLDLAQCFSRVSLSLQQTNIPPSLRLWLLTIGAISIVDESDYNSVRLLFLRYIQACDVHDWTSMRSRMQEYMWISIIHDKPGEEFFEHMVRCG